MESFAVTTTADAEKFTATADHYAQPKSALHTLSLRTKYEPRRLEAIELKSNNHGGRKAQT